MAAHAAFPVYSRSRFADFTAHASDVPDAKREKKYHGGQMMFATATFSAALTPCHHPQTPPLSILILRSMASFTLLPYLPVDLLSGR